MQPGVRVASPARRFLRFQQFLIYTRKRTLSQSNFEICTWGNSRLDRDERNRGRKSLLFKHLEGEGGFGIGDAAFVRDLVRQGQ